VAEPGADEAKGGAGSGAGSDAGSDETEPMLTCDFCGAEAPRVRRVALDRGYDRLQTPHQVRYACERCSEEKERQRRGAGPA
jgi:hypothetical protein